jgi:hypothetical protein
MTHTILLSKVLGLFAIIVGSAMVLKRRQLGEVISTFGRNRTWRVLFSAIELMAGLFLVMMHDDWASAPAIIVSLAGWLAVIESSAYLLLPDRVIEPFITSFSRPGALAVSGVISVAIGLYLAAYGFGVA